MAHDYEDNRDVFHAYLKYLKRQTGKDLEEKSEEAKKLSRVIQNINLILDSKMSQGENTALGKYLVELDWLCDSKFWTKFLNARNKQKKTKEFKKNKEIVLDVNLKKAKIEKRKETIKEKLIKDDPDFAENLVEIFDKFLRGYTALPIENGENLVRVLSAIFHDLNPDNGAYLSIDLEISDKETALNWLRKMDDLFTTSINSYDEWL